VQNYVNVYFHGKKGFINGARRREKTAAKNRKLWYTNLTNLYAERSSKELRRTLTTDLDSAFTAVVAHSADAERNHGIRTAAGLPFVSLRRE